MATKSKTITIERPFGGWISTPENTSTTTPTASLEGKHDQYAYSNGISLYRLEKLGHIAPGEIFGAITDTKPYIVALALNGDVASTGNSFIVLKNAWVIKTSTDGTSVSDYIVPVAHGGQTITSSSNADMIVFKDPTGAEYVVSTWEDGGGADAMIVDPTLAKKTSAWLSAGNSTNYLTAVVPLKLTQGPDGNIYGTNRQYLWSATMGVGVGIGAATKNVQALNLGAGWTATGITAYKNFVATIAYRSTTYLTGVSRGDCRVFFWDGFSQEPNFVVSIPDNFANGIYFDGSKLYVLTNGRNNSSKLWEFNGASFDIKFESQFVGTSSTPIQGFLESYQQSLHIATTVSSLGKIFQWNNGFHNRTIVTDGTNGAIDIGMLKNLYQTQLFCGVQTGASTFKVYYQNQFTQYYVNADFRTRLFTNWDDGSTMRKGKTKKFHLWFSQFGTNASLLLSFFKGYGTFGIGGANDLMNKTLTNTTLGALKYYSFDLEIDDFESFYMNLRFNHAATTDTAAILRKMVVECEETDIY